MKVVPHDGSDAKPGDGFRCPLGTRKPRNADFRSRVDFAGRGIENPGPRVDVVVVGELTKRPLSGMLMAFHLGGTSMSPSIIAISADDAGRTPTV